MVPQVTSGGQLDALPLLGRLNVGVVHLNADGWLLAYNQLALTLLDIDVPLGTPVRFEESLAANREEHHLLRHLLLTRAELRNHVVTWAKTRRIRHVLIDTYRDESVQFNPPAPVVTPEESSGIYIVMKDLGDFVSLDQHLQRTDKLAVVGKVAAGVAHEIRNPLTTVRGFLQVMMTRMNQQDLEQERQYLTMMVHEVDKVEHLVTELLLLSKPRQMAHQTVHLGEWIRRLQPDIQAKSAEVGCEVNFEIAADLPTIHGDESSLAHVLHQLVENAMDAMDSGGRLTVKIRSDLTTVSIEVHDTGPGIPYYQMDQVFDVFFTTKDKGTGLGLPICKKIVADHGGEIYVSSKGFGTTFSIVLPSDSSTRWTDADDSWSNERLH